MNKEEVVKITPEIRNRVVEQCRRFCREISKSPPDKAADSALSGLSAEKQVENIQNIFNREWGLDFNLEGKKILEIGSGYGIFLVYGIKQYGLELRGIEPGEDSYEGRFETSREILRLNGIPEERIIKSTAEKLPFEDFTFDFVYSNVVLEHVSNVEKVITEAVRVAKENGFVFFNVPNYNSFREGHYNIFWLPYIGKTIAKIYVSVMGRNPRFINDLNFITPQYLARIVSRIEDIDIIGDYGFSDWNWAYRINLLIELLKESRPVNTAKFKFIRNLFVFIKKFRFLSREFEDLLKAVMVVLRKLQWQPMIHLIIRKKAA